MATKTATAEKKDSQTEQGDSPLLDKVNAEVKKMMAQGKERGFVTYDQLNAALPPDQVSSEQIEDTMSMLSEAGINVVENEDNDDSEEEKPEKERESSSGNVDENEIGRSDDPVRMYLREMGRLNCSREGECYRQRIEAGREMMIGGIVDSPMTIRALLRGEMHWMKANLLRDIADLDATYSAARTYRGHRRGWVTDSGSTGSGTQRPGGQA